METMLEARSLRHSASQFKTQEAGTTGRQRSASKAVEALQEQTERSLRQALMRRQLVIIVGMGLSLDATENSVSHIAWNELIRNGLEYFLSRHVGGRKKRVKQALLGIHSQSRNPGTVLRKYLSAANILRHELDEEGLFAPWLWTAFNDLYDKVCSFGLLDVLKDLQKHGALILTTNYDDLLERHCSNLNRVCPSDIHGMRELVDRSKEGILHVHGSYQDPESVVLDAVNYYKEPHQDAIRSILDHVLKTETVLFVGCGEGLQDPNCEALVEWAAERTLAGRRHYFLAHEDSQFQGNTHIKLIYGTGREVQVLRRLLAHPVKGLVDGVNSIVFSEDGKMLAAASIDQKVRLFDPVTGHCLQTLHGHTEQVLAVAFSRDRKMLASASCDKTLQLWDLTTGRRLRILRGHNEPVLAIAFSRDGRTLASTSYDKTVQLWDSNTGRRLKTLQSHSVSVTEISFRQDGKVLISGPFENTAHLWDPISGSLKFVPPYSVGLGKETFFPKDGKMLVSVSYDQVVQLPDPATEDGLQELVGVLELGNPWEIIFFADLSGFSNLLDDRTDSVLTVTESSQNAITKTAPDYIRWRWGQLGMEIFKWLSSVARCSRLRTAPRLCIYGENESFLELQGQLCDELAASNLAIQVRRIGGEVRYYNRLVSNIASELAWIMATFKKPPPEGLSFSRTKIRNSFNDEDRCLIFRIESEDAQDENLKDGEARCWQKLFPRLNVAVGFHIPLRTNELRGVEIPFWLMTTLSDVHYPVIYRDGFALKGYRTALIPVKKVSATCSDGKVSAMQWHFFQSDRPRLYMEEVEQVKPPVCAFKTDISPTEFLDMCTQAESHYLGLYQTTRVCVGTNDSQAGAIKTTVGHNSIKEERTKYPLTWDRHISGSFGGGAFGLSAGFGTGWNVREERDRRFHLQWPPGLRDELEKARTNLTLLYNVHTGVAWLLPNIFVVMHLVQAWASLRYENTKFDYPTFHDMSLDSLENGLRDLQTQPAAAARQINFLDQFFSFSNALDQLQDNKRLKPSKNRLAGVDFVQIVQKSPNYSVLTKKFNDEKRYCGNWPSLLQCNWEDWTVTPRPCRVITLFCRNLNPHLISPVGMVCGTWYPPPARCYMITLLHCLRLMSQRHGSGHKLSRDHVWIRGTYGPYDGCHGRACDRLQKIEESNKRQQSNMLQEVSDLPENAAVVFGGAFCIDANTLCQKVSPQLPAESPQSPAESPQLPVVPPQLPASPPEMPSPAKESRELDA